MEKGKKKILVVNGPNLNILGWREPGIYGTNTYTELVAECNKAGEDFGATIEVYQSNHEGDLIDKIQSARNNFDGIVINAGGYSHTSVAILDALKAVNLPTVTVHLTEIGKREHFRRKDLMAHYAAKKITGKGLAGYREAISFLVK